jgi:hypothetical protein
MKSVVCQTVMTILMVSSGDPLHQVFDIVSLGINMRNVAMSKSEVDDHISIQVRYQACQLYKNSCALHVSAGNPMVVLPLSSLVHEQQTTALQSRSDTVF